MAAWIAAARQAANFNRYSAPKSANLLHRRGLASGGGGDHHGTPKVNFWDDPLSPSKWKRDQFVIVSLAGWGLLIYGGYKFFAGNKGDDMEKKVGERAH